MNMLMMLMIEKCGLYLQTNKQKVSPDKNASPNIVNLIYEGQSKGLHSFIVQRSSVACVFVMILFTS